MRLCRAGLGFRIQAQGFATAFALQRWPHPSAEHMLETCSRRLELGVDSPKHHAPSADHCLESLTLRLPPSLSFAARDLVCRWRRSWLRRPSGSRSRV